MRTETQLLHTVMGGEQWTEFTLKPNLKLENNFQAPSHAGPD